GDNAQGHDRKNGKDQAKAQRILFKHSAGWNWTFPCPPHQRIYIGIVSHIEGARRARPGRDGEKRCETDDRVDMQRGDQNRETLGKAATAFADETHLIRLSWI